MRDEIKLIYPDILDSQFSIQDDGQGPYFKVWTYPQPQPTQAQIDAVTPVILKAVAQDRISASYQAAVDALTAGYPQDEIASWPKQEKEARAWLADNTVSTPWVDAAAASRGIAKADFVTLIIGNADALAPLHGSLTGKRQKLRDEITALGSTPTQAQLDAIQW